MQGGGALINSHVHQDTPQNQPVLFERLTVKAKSQETTDKEMPQKKKNKEVKEEEGEKTPKPPQKRSSRRRT